MKMMLNIQACLRRTGWLVVLAFMAHAGLFAQDASFEVTYDAEGEVDPEELARSIEMLEPYLGPDNSMLRLAKASANNPVIAEPMEQPSQQFLSGLFVSGMQAMATSMLPMLVVTYLGFFAGAYVGSRLLAPRHGTVANAAIFAAIPVAFQLIGFLLIMLGNPMVTVLGSSLLGVAALVTLIIATMYLYDVGFVTMLLFGIVGTLIQWVVSAILGGIMMAVLGASMLGPICNAVGNTYAEQTVAMIDGKVSDLQPKKNKLADDVATARADLEALKRKEADVQKQLQEKQAEISSKRQTPQLVYTSIGQLVDQNKTQQAIASYAEFAAKFSGHPLAAAAKKQIEALENMQAQNEADRAAARAAALEAERKRLESFKQNLGSGKISLAEIRTNLLGKTREEVIELLGMPDGEQANVLVYTRIEVYDPVRRRSRSILVNFLDRRVQGVGYIR